MHDQQQSVYEVQALAGIVKGLVERRRRISERQKVHHENAVEEYRAYNYYPPSLLERDENDVPPVPPIVVVLEPRRYRVGFVFYGYFG